MAASQSLVCLPGMCRSLLNAPHCPFGGFIYLRSIFDLFALNRSNRSPGVNFWSHLWLSTAIDPPGLSPTDWSANSAIVHIIGELQIDLFFPEWRLFVKCPCPDFCWKVNVGKGWLSGMFASNPGERETSSVLSPPPPFSNSNVVVGPGCGRAVPGEFAFKARH